MRHPASMLGITVASALIVNLPLMAKTDAASRTLLMSQPLTLAQANTSDSQAEANYLLQQGIEQYNISQFQIALQTWLQALELFRSLGDKAGEATALSNIGIVHQALGNYPETLAYFEQSLALSQELSNRIGEAITLGHMGIVYGLLGNYPEALSYYEQSLTLSLELGDRAGEANTLGNIGVIYRLLGNYPEALKYYRQSLVLTRALRDRTGEADTLGNIGIVYQSLGKYPEALQYHGQSLALTRALGDRAGEANTLGNVGNIHGFLGNYSEALNYYEQSLVLSQTLGDRAGEADTLSNIGIVYRLLGQYPEALDYHEQSLVLSQTLGDRAGEADTLNNVGIVYQFLGRYPEALDYHKQSLVLSRTLGDRAGEANALGNIGIVYRLLENYTKALDYTEQSLRLAQELGGRAGEADALVNFGDIHRLLENRTKALSYFQEGLILTRELGDRAGEARTLGLIGKLLSTQAQPELAIIFLKASVTVRESIRVDNQSLDIGLQQSYTDTVADDYRLLADLLLEQGRIPEAQQVLDLLKLEELREFTDTTRATWNGNSLVYTNDEAAVFESYNELIEFGQRLYECQQTTCADLNALLTQQQPLIAAYNDQVAEFEAMVRERSAADPQLFTNPDNLSGKAQELLAANPNSVLIYPFVTDDKLWLLWATPGAVGSVEIEDVNRGEISNTVQRFGELLTLRGDYAELQATSQQLYNWLVEPLETALQANDIEHLIFVHDRVTRYIPMAALFDGEQFLMERYTISTVIAPEITDTEDRLTNVNESQVLGLGLSQPVREFDALPAVEPELNNIILSGANDDTGIYPGEVYLNEAFTLAQLQASVLNHRVLHIASHAKFEPVRKEESFIVLGNGDELRVTDIDNLHSWLGNLHLVVLSACQTALGGTDDGDGTEIAGIASYFLKEGRAEAVLASLWAVNDRSTSVLMQRFYELLSSGELTKAEALRQAQLSLLYGEDTETRLTASRTGAPPMTRDGFDVTMAEPGYRHPYYWAPFILIGNGL